MVRSFFVVRNAFFHFSAAQDVMRIGLRRHAFHFGNGNHRQKSQEQQETREKQPESSDVSADIDNRWMIISPIRREKITVQTDDDDYEPFEPHADVHDD